MDELIREQCLSYKCGVEVVHGGDWNASAKLGSASVERRIVSAKFGNLSGKLGNTSANFGIANLGILLAANRHHQNEYQN